MHKAKPHKGIVKRIKVSAKRKLVRKSSFAGHLMTGKSGLRRQRLRRDKIITGRARRTILRKLGLKTAWPYPPARTAAGGQSEKGA